MATQNESINLSNTNINQENNPFANVIGYESVKKELYQIIDMFENKEKYEKIGAKLCKGIILTGAPGLGKSLICNDLIKACNVSTFYIINNKNQNETIDDIAEVFSKAKNNTPSIVFIDDIDKLSCSDREDVDDKVFAAIQAGIDSVKDYDVLTIATANRIRKLPSSLLRAGRLSRKIILSSPLYDDAKRIIEYYLSSKNVCKDLDYDDIAKMINYSSCAELEDILNEASIHAAYLNKEKVEMNDIVYSFLKDEYISPDETVKCSDEELEATCIHECGHAVIAEILKPGCVGFVSVQKDGRSPMAGFTRLWDELKRRPEVVTMALGGKVACELFYQAGRCATGCHSDLEKAADLVRKGLSESGTCGLGGFDVANSRFPNTSENMNSRSEAVTQAELERYMFIAKDIIFKNKDFLFALVNKLKEKNYLLASDIEEVKKNVKITPYVLN